MEGVLVGWGNATAEIGVNRRFAETVDRRVGILKVCNERNDGIKLIILRVTAHGNVLKRDNYLISADYFGTVRGLFAQKYHCPVMVIQGSAGNIAPKYYCSTIIPVDGRGEAYINSATALEDMAQEVLRKAEAMINSIKMHPYISADPLRVRQGEVPCADFCPRHILSSDVQAARNVSSRRVPKPCKT